MRKFAGNYLSGRVQVKKPDEVTSSRYDYLGLDEAEPNLGATPSDFIQTFTSIADNKINIAGHSLSTGEKVVYDFDDVTGNTAVTNLESRGTYYVRSHDADNFFLCATKPAALDPGGTIIQLPDQPNNAGQHYIGKETVLTSTITGVRSLVDLGDDFELEKISGSTNYKLKLSDGVQQGITTTIETSTALQSVCTVGNTTTTAIDIQNTTDSTNLGVGALIVDGGASIAKTLRLDDTKSIVWNADGGTNDAYTRDSEITSTYVDNIFNGKSSIDFVVANRDQQNLTLPSDIQATVLSLKANLNDAGGRQQTEIILGKAEDNETFTGQSTTPSKTTIRTNQTLVLAPADVGATSNTGTVQIAGNLEVLGTQTTVNSTTLEVTDLNIVAAKDATTPALTIGAGLTLGSYPTSPTATSWVDPNNLGGQAANPLPSMVWDGSGADARFLFNKGIEASSVKVTGAISSNVGYLKSDGTVDTSTFEIEGTIVNSTYSLDANTVNSNAAVQLTDNGGNSDIIEYTTQGGLSITATAGTGGSNAILDFDASSVAGTTYSLKSATSTVSSNVDLTIANLTGSTSTDTVTFIPTGNISITATESVSTAGDQITIGDVINPSYSHNNAKITISHLASGSGTQLDAFDENDLALEVSSATVGSVAKFSRTTQGDHSNGGVLLLEVNDDATSARNPWISFMNVGTAVNDANNPCQGEITTKFSDNTEKSGIRIWGQRNIDFETSTSSKPNGIDLTTIRCSVTDDGLTLRNSSSLIVDGGSYKTTIGFTTPTADRTVTFPDASGEVAIIGNFIAGGPITTVNASANADHYIVFAEDAVSAPGSNQDPLTNTSLKFNPSTGTLTATSKSFLIDHPTKDGMKLQYTCLEGPENGVYVRGRLKDDNVIELPDYWLGLVDENTITVNLTPIGHSQDLYVQDITDNQVIINDNVNINCFYTIFAERKDIDKLVVEFEDV
jgi:hypothetical protein